MAKCNNAVTPLLTHWSYCSLALSHRYHVEEMTRPWGATINLRRTIGWILLFQEINSTAAAIAVISPYSAEFNLGNMKYIAFLSILKTEMFRVLLPLWNKPRLSCIFNTMVVDGMAMQRAWASVTRPLCPSQIGIFRLQHQRTILLTWIKFYPSTDK